MPYCMFFGERTTVPCWTPSDEGIEYRPETRLVGDCYEDKTYCKISGIYLETDSKLQSLRTV